VSTEEARTTKPHPQQLFRSQLVVINVGPKVFAEALEKQGVEVVQVDWKPLAGGDKEMQDILSFLGGY
jgi:FdrA protein